MKTTHGASNAIVAIKRLLIVFIIRYILYLLVFIHLEDTISFSPSRYVKSLLPSPLSVPSPFDDRNGRHYPRKFRCLLDKMSVCLLWPNLTEFAGQQLHGESVSLFTQDSCS